MKKSKITLLFNYLLIVLCILAVYRILSFSATFKFYNNNGNDYGTVINIKKNKNYNVLIINGSKTYKAYVDSKQSVNYGDYIFFEYINRDISNATIFNTFNYKKYLKSKNINQEIIINKLYKIKNKKNYFYKGKFVNYINTKKSGGYILNFICGDKNMLDYDIKESYSNNGINHLLCVSGFHVLFLLNILKGVSKKLFKKEYISIFLLLIISIIYLILTSFLISLFRAVLLYFMLYYNKRFNINYNKLLIFIYVLFISLLLFPYSVYNLSFWYSFVLTFFLLVSKYNLNNVFKLSSYCFIISIPLTIYFNYSINFLSIILSSLFSYVVCFLMYPLSFLSLLSNKIDNLLYLICRLFEKINLCINQINLFRINVGKISVILLIIFYILIFLAILERKKIYFIIVIFYFLFLIIRPYFDSNEYVYFLDVKQGDMAVHISKYHKKITVIDTGGIVDNESLFNNIKTFLYSNGINIIDNLILTHGDYDHMGYAVNLVNNFKINKVVFNCGEFNDLEKDLINALDKKNIKYYSCINKVDNFNILNTRIYDNENDNSNVIFINMDNYKFMFMGDAGVEKEKDILEKYSINNVDVLKVGHHGSKTSSSKDFINSVNPRYGVISVGKKNRYGHPNKEVLNNLETSNIYRTDINGSVKFVLNDNLKIKTCSQ